MSVSLIAVDVDGTLINSEGRVTDETKEAFREATKAGIHLALGTGRARDECTPILKQLPELRYMINCSGASVYDIALEKELYVEGIPMEIIRRCYDILKDIPVYLFEPMIDGHVYADRERMEHLSEFQDHYYIETVRSTRTPTDIEVLLETRMEPVPRLHLFFPNHETQERARKLLEPVGLPILNSIPENLELNMPTANKGLGLRRLAEYLNVPLENCMAIGDNLNDADMLKAAGYPVLMANAHTDVLQYGKYRTKSCDEDGVAHAIRHVLNGTVEAMRKEQ